MYVKGGEESFKELYPCKATIASFYSKAKIFYNARKLLHDQCTLKLLKATNRRNGVTKDSKQ